MTTDETQTEEENKTEPNIDYVHRLGNRLFFYGPPKIGLTTFAQEFTNAEFVCFNNPHLSKLRVKSVNIETMDEFRIWFKEAYYNLEQATYIFDSFDGLQDVIAADIALKAGVPNINNIEYQNGYFNATELFKKILGRLDLLVTKGHSLVFLGHSTTIPYKGLDLIEVVRHVPSAYIKNHKGDDISMILCNWVDGIFFVNICNRADNLDIYSNLALDANRYIYTSPSIYYLGGNRLGLTTVEALDAISLEHWINHNNNSQEKK